MMFKWDRPYLFADSGGGAPAPAESSPAPTTPDSGASSSSTSVDSGGGGESLDFQSIFDDRGLEPTVDLGLTETPAVQPPTTPAPPPQQAAPPVQPTPQQPVVQPQAPAQAPVQQPQTAQDPLQGLDSYDPVQLGNALAANEQQLTDVLASQVFGLSPQEVEALETNAAEVIPRLMARVLVQAQKSMLFQMGRMLPVMMQRHNETTRDAGTAEETFYKAWPDLDRSKHGQLVYGYGRVFRQMYPKATLQDLISHVGPMVMVAARVQPRTAQPLTPQRGVNGRSPQPSPFVPAAGAGPVSGNSRNDMTPWEAMFAQQE